jgi:hypothetical protein
MRYQYLDVNMLFKDQKRRGLRVLYITQKPGTMPDQQAHLTH